MFRIYRALSPADRVFVQNIGRGAPNSWSRHLTASALGKRPPPRRKQKELPELAIPEESTAPMVDSDLKQYLVPLYAHGWKFCFDLRNGEGEHRTALRCEGFRFLALKALVAFTESTRDAPGGDISIFTNLEAAVFLHPPEGITHNLIRLAVKIQTAYLNIVGPGVNVKKVNERYNITSFKRMRFIKYSQKTGTLVPPLPPTHVTIVPAPLPPAPQMFASPQPSIIEADLETYIVPLINNGWELRVIQNSPTFPEVRASLKGYYSLHRVFRFTDYPAARHFLHAVATRIPTQPQRSLAGVQMNLRSTTNPGLYELLIWSISELDADAPAKYGVSLADVRFAIEVNNEFTAKWGGRSHNTALDDRFIPTTMEKLWSFRTRPKRAAESLGFGIRPGEEDTSAEETEREPWHAIK
ncbi:hypothetical protein DFH07DRAFT_937968 [Mycena maculata]|uniref:Uncharacterized protein n=1 Tax=Mycena maculata TaxID=230809 RepID=A0AAD7JT16_9AGAR|nr:hypothetical protein DFH07DRAFT_937968 [Mycena maculata]